MVQLAAAGEVSSVAAAQVVAAAEPAAANQDGSWDDVGESEHSTCVHSPDESSPGYAPFDLTGRYEYARRSTHTGT